MLYVKLSVYYVTICFLITIEYLVNVTSRCKLNINRKEHVPCKDGIEHHPLLSMLTINCQMAFASFDQMPLTLSNK